MRRTRSHDDNLDGYAWHLKNALPRATLIAFTSTPVSFTDRNTREVFGGYIDIYVLTRAVEDGATVPVQRRCRLAVRSVRLPETESPEIERLAGEPGVLVNALIRSWVLAGLAEERGISLRSAIPIDR